LILLKQENIPVLEIGIGNITKSDIISAKANVEINEIDGVIAGFNVSIEEDAKEILQQEKEVKVITDGVIYKLIENLSEWRVEKSKEIEKKRMMGLATLCKLKILHQYVFRNSNPAIFGVRVEGGKLVKDVHLINESGEKVGRVKNIHSENKPINEAKEGMEVAISIPGLNFERALKEFNFLYTDISEKQFKEFKKNKDLLSGNEIKALQEISELKRKNKTDWGL
jgi:translation initiation factor 5B